MNRRAVAIADLERRLGHAFGDPGLLDQALTHASIRVGGQGRLDNDRLEFLGDRVLGLVIAHHLLAENDIADSGALSKRLHGLVSGTACARVARSLNLGEALRLRGGETRRGARDHDTILADACEAVIAAVYLELGLERTAEIVLAAWGPLLIESIDPDAANPKSELQEWAAATGRPQPVYRMVARAGPAHQPRFTVEVGVEGVEPVRAEGGSLRIAEKAAALDLLRRERGQT